MIHVVRLRVMWHIPQISEWSLKSYLQPHTEDVFLVEFFGEEDCVLDMLVIEQQVYLLGDVISQSKLYSALIIGPDLTQFIAHVRRLISS